MNQPRYFSFRQYTKDLYGTKVHKVSIDAGFTCPNIDGLKGTGGCTFCNNAGFSVNTRKETQSVAEQLTKGMTALRKRYQATKFIAYFQAFSNTYAPVAHLQKLYDAALEPDEVVGMSVGTRPDCVSPATLRLLDSYTAEKDVWIEYGLQTSHDRTLKAINRCETYADFQRAVEMTAGYNLKVCVHLILGLPGETVEDMLVTAERLRDVPYHSLKVHILHIMSDTQMARDYAFGCVRMMDRDAYVDTTVRVLERIRPDVSMQRLTADAPLSVLIAPMWCMDKDGILQDILQEMERRDTWQGKLLGYPRNAVGVYKQGAPGEVLAVPA